MFVERMFTGDPLKWDTAFRVGEEEHSVRFLFSSYRTPPLNLPYRLIL
jgi:hypothetical protein